MDNCFGMYSAPRNGNERIWHEFVQSLLTFDTICLFLTLLMTFLLMILQEGIYLSAELSITTSVLLKILYHAIHIVTFRCNSCDIKKNTHFLTLYYAVFTYLHVKIYIFILTFHIVHSDVYSTPRINFAIFFFRLVCQFAFYVNVDFDSYGKESVYDYRCQAVWPFGHGQCCDLFGHYKRDKCQTFQGASTHWAVSVHSTSSDRSRISRS